ncbi:unnamed protein product, partial [Didymodactylos carnosus]
PSSVILLPNSNTPPMRVRHYFVFSLISSILLCPATGLIALAYSLKSSAKADIKFLDKARLYSRRALIWNLISLVIAVFSLVMMLIFFYYVNQIWLQYAKTYGEQLKDEFSSRYNSHNVQLFNPERNPTIIENLLSSK